MLFSTPLPSVDPLRQQIRTAYRADETACVESLIDLAQLTPEQHERIAARARALATQVRIARSGKGGLDAFLQEYGLASNEGIVLLCLAEALLRIPDADTAERLIRDKLAGADWRRHLGASESLLVNASTWALMLTGRILRLEATEVSELTDVLGRMLARASDGERLGYRYSYDMLGEAARTAHDAERYMRSYQEAIAAIGRHAAGRWPITGPGISIKLSALHPRYEFAQRERVLSELVGRLRALALAAKAHAIGLTVDAEEAERLDLSLDVIETVSGDTALAGWDGFGLAIQAYQKRCAALIDWLAALAHRQGRRLPVRLVKGAYWDSEIKWSQERGLPGYPVFTRKVSTDVSYLACARKLLADPAAFYPQFATHNVQTFSAVLEMAGRGDFEFQRLHGMGEALYDQVIAPEGQDITVRVYAPVGSHEDLLPYLVRRLLENGANTSFVNRLVDDAAPIDDLIADPVAMTRRLHVKPHPRIPLPADLYAPERRNSQGLDLSDPAVLEPLGRALAVEAGKSWSGGPIVGGRERTGDARPVTDPSDRRRIVGHVLESSASDVAEAIDRANRAARGWDAVPAAERAARLRDAADRIEAARAHLMALLIREGGKTIGDAVAEVREAADFCRYYARRAELDFAGPVTLPGPTGERNELALAGRGAFACISPWNFPLSIFAGQIAGALAAGNTVVAKPAEQTPLIAAATVRILHQAGIPQDALALLPGDGSNVGASLVASPAIAGVAFTGSTETARLINATLAARTGPIVPFIAETGGQNAMIVDSSALPEQVVRDVLTSAFQSAGQRCSSLRALFLQEDIAASVEAMLVGAMRELRVGDPALLATDIGPVIDGQARETLEAHAERMRAEGQLLHAVALGPDCAHGSFFAPCAFRIDRIGVLQREVFGPILHVIHYSAAALDHVLDEISDTGYGLTLGIHSRIESTVNHVRDRARVGNIYVNRNMIGAVVGVQPFGGEGLSGTGPKAGGPRYLHRFATERSVAEDTTAAGGNAALLTIAEDQPH